MQHFGEHVTVDGYNGDYDLLNNKDIVLKTLQEMPEAFGMSILGGPVVYFAKGNDSKDPGGWSGFVVIQESHISIHTFPARGFFSADVYTCKNGMDQDAVSQYFKNIFKTTDEEVYFLKRGTRYPEGNITIPH